MLAVIVAIVTVVWTSPVESLTGYKGDALSYELNLQTPPAEPDLSKGVRDQVEMPDELKADLRVQRLGRLSLSLTRQRFMGLPTVIVATDNSTRTPPNDNKNVYFYLDKTSRASLACDLQIDRNTGERKCQTSALFSLGNYSCYIGDGMEKADCSPNTYSGSRDFVYKKRKADVPDQPITVGVPSPRGRWAQEQVAGTKADFVLPAPGSKTMEYVTVVDRKLIQVFYDRYSDDSKAQTDARMYIALMAIEVNVWYDSFRVATNGAMSLFVYPTSVIIPERGADFRWSKRHNDGRLLMADDTCDNRMWSYTRDTVLPSINTDHVMFLTGYDLRVPEGDILGYAYQATVCADVTWKYSICEFPNDVGATVAHELGHALGASHDEDVGCSPSSNLMTGNTYQPGSSTIDDFFQVSSCTRRDIKRHLNSKTACTLDNDFTAEQFKELFCSGFLGSQSASSLDDQCKISTGYADSTACDSVTRESQCYAFNSLRCTTSNGQCDGAIGFLWNGTPCGTGQMCFKGRCVSDVEVCPDGGTTPGPTTPGPTTPGPDEAPCSCCHHSKNRKRKRCCRRGRKKHAKADCYCCGDLRKTEPPSGWTGPEY